VCITGQRSLATTAAAASATAVNYYFLLIIIVYLRLCSVNVRYVRSLIVGHSLMELSNLLAQLLFLSLSCHFYAQN